MTAVKACDVTDCAKPHRARGWCQAHWERWRRYGDPVADGVGHREPLHIRFFTKVAFGEDGCWRWTPGKGRYGRFYAARSGNSNAYPHRWAYEFCVGQIPAGMTIDHLCRNTRCVNPEHLEVVTHAENSHRAQAFLKNQRAIATP